MSSAMVLWDLSHNILGVLRRKQTRTKLLAQLLYSPGCTCKPWPAARAWNSAEVSEHPSVHSFIGQPPRQALANPEVFCRSIFFLSLSTWIYCATTAIIWNPFQRLLWIEKGSCSPETRCVNLQFGDKETCQVQGTETTPETTHQRGNKDKWSAGHCSSWRPKAGICSRHHVPVL